MAAPPDFWTMQIRVATRHGIRVAGWLKTQELRSGLTRVYFSLHHPRDCVGLLPQGEPESVFSEVLGEAVPIGPDPIKQAMCRQMAGCVFEIVRSDVLQITEAPEKLLALHGFEANSDYWAPRLRLGFARCPFCRSLLSLITSRDGREIDVVCGSERDCGFWAQIPWWDRYPGAPGPVLR